MKDTKRLEQVRGITLIALVVTIVILIILATISVNLVLNGGLVSRTSKGKEKHELEREKERLELVKVDVASDTNHLGKVTIDTYVEELINQGITTAEEIVDNGDGSRTVITDTGYSVLIKPRGENDVEIIIEGKVGELPPRIKQVNVTKEETSIVVEVIAIRTEGATYSYEYQEVGGTWKPAGENKANITINGTAEEKSYIIRVTVKNEYGEDTKEKLVEVEDILPEPPALSDGMIPVKWDGTNWIKTTKEDKEWYNYSSKQKKWANIVLGNSTFIEQNGKEVLNTTEAYCQLVWIPRYAYKITTNYHTSTFGKIEVQLIDRNNMNKLGVKFARDSAEQYPEAVTGGAMSDFVVHPAFDFGGKKLSGFWIGKYESSKVGGAICSMIGKQPSNIGISNYLAMNSSRNVYKISSSDSVVDPHRPKNTEWGAVAYFSTSKYGVEANVKGVTTTKLTGESGVQYSTTGNEWGAYDMGGNYWESVAISTTENSRYYDKIATRTELMRHIVQQADIMEMLFGRFLVKNMYL